MTTKPAPLQHLQGKKWDSNWLYKMQSERVKVLFFFHPIFFSCYDPNSNKENGWEKEKEKTQIRVFSHLLTAIISSLVVQVADFKKSMGKNINRLGFNY